MDRDLVEQAQRGDREAFAILARTHGDRLMSIAQRILRDVGRAEDAVQQTLVIAWRELPSLRDPDRFDAWLVMGGFAGERGTSQQMTVEIYDPAANTWTAAPDMHEGRVFASTTTLPDGRILIVGGHGPVVDGDIYDPSTGTWTSTDARNVGAEYVVSVLLADGTVFVTAGNGVGAILDPATRSWSPVDDGPAMPAIRSATALEDGRVLFVGLDVTQTASPAELFDPAALR
ncbi:MAG TPA: sigma factor [Candidatus Limnocylindrales bacterium]|nr:sigma factor [Candidatus Limnocylindrales bacterium]